VLLLLLQLQLMLLLLMLLLLLLPPSLRLVRVAVGNLDACWQWMEALGAMDPECLTPYVCSVLFVLS
jgi:hypothetical protein